MLLELLLLLLLLLLSHAPLLLSTSALMALPSALRDRLILVASFSRSPDSNDNSSGGCETCIALDKLIPIHSWKRHKQCRQACQSITGEAADAAHRQKNSTSSYQAL
jgi:hypothetical protein